jgi:hypothetical protein
MSCHPHNTFAIRGFQGKSAPGADDVAARTETPRAATISSVSARAGKPIAGERRQAWFRRFSERGGRASSGPPEGGHRGDMQQKAATIGKEGMDKALAVLSADQKQAWKEMTGEPFEVRFQGFPVFRRPDN